MVVSLSHSESLVFGVRYLHSCCLWECGPGNFGHLHISGVQYSLSCLTRHNSAQYIRALDVLARLDGGGNLVTSLISMLAAEMNLKVDSPSKHSVSEAPGNQPRCNVFDAV
jgi:hypothetical protein